MVLVSDLVTHVRDNLDEPTAAQWSNDQLVRWLNEGARDLARSTKFLKGKHSIPVVAGTSEYNLPAYVLAVEHCYFQADGDTRQIPLVAKHYEGMDSVWGSWQNQESYSPQFYTTIGLSPVAIIKVYPVPDVTGDLNLLCSRTYTEMAIPYSGGATADVPNVWWDALVDYCEFKALRRDRDQRWQEAFDLYTQKREGLMVNPDFNAENREIVATPGGAYIDSWLVEPEWYA